jgi:putative tryptophan/tyrosine transport system substrate-binding protein
MRRREFITFLGAAAATWPLAARAQQNGSPRVAALMAFKEDDPEEQLRVNALREGLQAFGWRERTNIQIDWRFAAGDLSLMQRYTSELVNLKPTVILAENTPVTAAVLRKTHEIPIVFVSVGDPVGSGFVASLARPGGNATGFTNYDSSLSGKWVALLKEVSPQTHKVALLFNPSTAPTAGEYFLPSFQDAARSLGMEPIPSPVHNPEEIESALTAIAKESGGGLVVMPDTFLTVNRNQIIKSVAQNRTPAIYPYRYFVTDGGMLSYGINSPDILRRSAEYISRIIKGEKPADLPVQVPVKFELIINRRAFQALGLTVPQTLIATADEVIE